MTTGLTSAVGGALALLLAAALMAFIEAFGPGGWSDLGWALIGALVVLVGVACLMTWLLRRLSERLLGRRLRLWQSVLCWAAAGAVCWSASATASPLRDSISEPYQLPLWVCATALLWAGVSAAVLRGLLARSTS